VKLKRLSLGVGGLVLVLGVAAGVSGWGARDALDRGYALVQPDVAAAPPSIKQELGPVNVTALGRLEPCGGIIRVAGPSHTTVVVSKLQVEEGDFVKKGKVLAVLDQATRLEAEVERLRAELDYAEKEFKRKQVLHEDDVISTLALDSLRLKVNVAAARLKGARAQLSQAVVRAPTAGEVLKIHALEGERVGAEGVLELGRTQEMYVIAEVYETDIARVLVGQRADATSPVLAQALHGTVERIGRKIGKADILGTDPASKVDARVIEVEIRLDEGDAAAGLTNLQVEVEITP
jgi:HlyD family secretion protein